MVSAAGALLSHPRRFAHGFPSAAGFAAAGQRRAIIPIVNEQDPLEERQPLPPRPAKDLQKYFSGEWPEARGVGGGESGGLAQGICQQRPLVQELFARPVPPAAPRRIRLVDRPHGALRRAAPGAAARLHAAGADAGGLSGCVAAVEDTAELLDTPVIIEGYTPPLRSALERPQGHARPRRDRGQPRIRRTPWDEMVRHTKTLYEEARQSRLGTEKFMLDGRHTGTGGGNHIVIGGPTPADSPLLRRPDLLRSLVAYWQNHPSLSFLFSGLFIGPTSQSPRVDEARNDSLYELEVAFRELGRQIANHPPASPSLPSTGKEARRIPPWLADRLFRNLLIDATGNTHRAEFCIDKLYPPESASGRLGLLEMRAFEMPPHARMSLAQQLLLRTLIARFWHRPYTNDLVRWGTDIHDRWMLPHFVWGDFADVIEDLQRQRLSR